MRLAEKGKKFFSKAYLFPILLLAGIIFILFQFTLPQIKQIIEARGELKREKERLVQLIEKSTQLEKLDEVTLKKNFQVAQEALPSEKDVSGLLFTLARLESESTLSASGFKINPGLISTPAAVPKVATPSGVAKGKAQEPTEVKTKTTAPLSTLDFGLSLSGDFSALRSFLERIKEIRPLLLITSFNLSQEREASSGADLKVQFYYQVQPSFLGKISDPLSVLAIQEEEVLAEISRRPLYSQPPSSSTLVPIGKLNPFE